MIDQGVLDPKLHASYAADLARIREVEFIADRPHLSCEDVLDAHYLIGEHFRKLGEGMGGFGPKDVGLLSSAVARQVSSAGGVFIYNGVWEISASLLFGLINNHPFHDANKRTAFLSVVFFLLEEGYVPRVEIIEVEDFTVEIAEYNHKHGRHMEVGEIWPKLKTMFRERDNRISYVVTYRELDNLLKAHGCSLRNPNGNYIDVYKGDSRVTMIGFPGMNKEVGRKAIASVRKATGLTAENGFDAQVFFKGADPLNQLIGLYEEPLRRLADR
jgi:death-on-curing family protein